MPWAKFKRVRISTQEPFIIVNPDRFGYNSVIAKLADLRRNRYVVYQIDEEQRKIGFEFSSKNSPDSYPVRSRGQKAFRSSCGELVRAWLWVRKIAELRIAKERKFRAIKERNNFWTIQLFPAFEYRIKRVDESKIPSKARGIYRYLDKDGSIVYIGQGVIRTRVSESERADWNFDAIEYSIIEGQSEQLEWESYWIEKFKESNSNRLPYYNRVSGVKEKAR